MRLYSKAIAATVAATMLTSSAIAAGEAIRPASSISAASARLSVPARATTTRVGRRVEQQNSLLGAPLFIAFLGAVAVTIGTIVIVNNNDGPSSPG